MNLKKFKEYEKSYSKDPKTFENRIGFASQNSPIDLFKSIKTSSDFLVNESVPTIVWNDFSFTPSLVTESRSFLYNSKKLPAFTQICEDFNGATFIPSLTSDRSSVKKMKFPITGVSDSGNEDFKTYGKFKKSEKNFKKFIEKVIPNTRFEVIAYRNEPIHIQEKINKIGFDSDINRFKYSPDLEKITEALGKKYGVDFYKIDLLEANGKLYLESVSTSGDLSPSQSLKMYEKAYESYYETRLPNWFKNQNFDKYVKPYYESKYYDYLLIKPKNSIDFTKYQKHK